ncbi:5-(carboxyamino)imidazole ribonucleotide synthase [Microvirga sp. SRT01]|jgi:5-(carboxyamino)imidazole ribonucleotide synthase|uniref:N5-carboxyaminoimidazole ribonucleotide synthase n=1 Tax=Sphingomonas longa TaxID=2778730 RepID=A0ABS2D765_9SPHN|nr:MULTISPECIES: 5-(carboxyamino)imidazole ribonucleotide synthase [Alphaproteobacteria]MBM6576760.1 5-(carboxyamino)imidazole ribonucleotide synthase [Sphingomonas sp. BT552]MBR7709805.1 5-(carboxyamino)imidazole ribonucleotide synthase [Microvirga sp. SRT01]
MLQPGATIGILGGGQLGRMLAVAAAQLGYRTHVLAPDRQSVAAQTASSLTRADYHNRIVLADFAASCDVVTYEFENIAIGPVEWLAERVPVHPHPRALAAAQERIAEKRFVEEVGGRPARWAAVASREELEAAVASVGTPAVLKTARFGYDGKGQVRLHTPADADAAWEAIGGPAVLEAFVPFEHEFSVLIVRGQDGTTARYDAPLNVHHDAILRTSTLPAPAAVLAQVGEATDLACRIAARLDYVGVLACEFFVGVDGPVFNEMAPRVHNSGHWTIEGAECSQFENHIRAICGLPLGSTGLTGARVEMQNLIGDDAWQPVLAEPGAHLHLYGKGTPRPGRKMGHVTRVWR